MRNLNRHLFFSDKARVNIFACRVRKVNVSVVAYSEKRLIVANVGESLARNNSQLNRVVRRMDQILSRAEIPFRRLNRSVAQEKLNLLKLAAAGAAEFGASTAEVVWGDTRDPRRLGVGLDELPDDFLA